jgi:hypothetical protein
VSLYKIISAHEKTIAASPTNIWLCKRKQKNHSAKMTKYYFNTSIAILMKAAFCYSLIFIEFRHRFTYYIELPFPKQILRKNIPTKHEKNDSVMSC